MPGCTAWGCTNKNVKGSKHSFHRFPMDPTLKKLWVDHLNRSQFWPKQASLLCSAHFKESCMDRTGQIIRLREGAVPTIFEYSDTITRTLKRRLKMEGATPKELKGKFKDMKFSGKKFPKKSTEVPKSAKAKLDSNGLIIRSEWSNCTERNGVRVLRQTRTREAGLASTSGNLASCGTGSSQGLKVPSVGPGETSEVTDDADEDDDDEEEKDCYEPKTVRFSKNPKPGVWTNPMMEFRMIHQYRGKVKMVVFDWAGTVVDCGVFAPVTAFTNIFKGEGIDVLDEEVRAPMGAHKRVHIAQMMEMDRIADLWEMKKGKPATPEDVDRMYNNFLPEQIKALGTHAQVITGIPNVIRTLREDYKLKIGTSTGFTSEIMRHLVPMAATFGFEADFCATADQVKEARPTPNLLYMNMMNLNVNPVQAIVKVDDTVSGIMEGLSGGCWTIGVARTGNYMGATEEELEKMPKKEHDIRLKRAYKTLIESGAHYVIDSVNDIIPVIDDINRRLALGEKP